MPFELDQLDTEPMDIDAFHKYAWKDLCYFVRNVKHLKSFKNKNLSLFEWYIIFGRWNESLNFIDELGNRMKGAGINNVS